MRIAWASAVAVAVVLYGAGIAGAAQTRSQDLSAGHQEIEGKVKWAGPNQLTLEHDPGVFQSAKKLDFVINRDTKVLGPRDGFNLAQLQPGQQVSVMFQLDDKGQQVAQSIIIEEDGAAGDRAAQADREDQPSSRAD